MRDVPLDGRPLIASEVRDRLAAVVGPYLDATVASLDAPAQALARGQAEAEIDGRRWRCRMTALLQCHPPMLRAVLVGLPRRVELQRFTGAEVPGLDDVLEEIVAAVLSTLERDHAALALTAAARQRPGGFLAWFDPEDGSVRVMVAREGADLSTAVEVGGIFSEPATVH